MKYPTKEDTQRHLEEIERHMRTYILGYSKDSFSVENALKCLFTDLILEFHNSKSLEVKKGNFEQMIKGWI